MLCFSWQLAKNAETHQAETVRVMKENVLLIKEINDLRAELAHSKTSTKVLEVVIEPNEVFVCVCVCVGGADVCIDRTVSDAI